MIDVQVLSDSVHDLGEGPLWCPERQTLYWVDIHARRVHALENAGAAGAVARHWDLPVKVSALAVRQSGELILATEAGTANLNTNTGAFQPVLRIEDRPGNRSNEGKCDRQGRFWIGTMDDQEKRVSGALYRVDADNSVIRVLDDIGIPNTLAWTPDDRQMYFADTVKREIYRFEFDASDGSLSGKTLFARVPETLGGPDGSTIDNEGCLWTAIWGGGRLIRWTPDGRIDREIPLPVRQPTSCMFGGPNLDILFVTSARIGLDSETLRQEPHNGKVLAIQPPAGVRGFPESRYRG